jgi:outer membrane murein-binding lipoprotein Lpp
MLSVAQLFIGAAGLLVSVMGFLLVVGGGLLGAYVISQTNDATSEMSNAQLAQKIDSLEMKVDKMTDVVSASGRKDAEIESTLATLRRDLDRETEDRKGRDGWLEARIVSGK